VSQKCSHRTRQGEPCRAWAVRGSSPPRCAAHGGRVTGTAGPRGAGGQVQVPGEAQVPGGTQAREGSLDLNAVIFDLAEKHAQVSALIDRCLGSPETTSLGELLRLMQHHAQTASRLGRLLRDQRAVAGSVDDSWIAAINRTLDELSTEWGVEL
jgi:hypothetical protein